MSSPVDNRGRQRPRIGRCRDCHAHMLWVSIPSGKRVPLDPNPSSAGEYVYMLERDGVRLAVRTPDEELRDSLNGLGFKTYTHHFDTCPKRREERQR